jgi:hypothetical protein
MGLRRLDQPPNSMARSHSWRRSHPESPGLTRGSCKPHPEALQDSLTLTDTVSCYQYPPGSTFKWRRNYVLHLMNTNNPADTFLNNDFASAAWYLPEAYFQTPINKEDVMCAVSTQGSTRTRVTSFNGYCWSGVLKPYGNWADKAEFKG